MKHKPRFNNEESILHKIDETKAQQLALAREAEAMEAGATEALKRPDSAWPNNEKGKRQMYADRMNAQTALDKSKKMFKQAANKDSALELLKRKLAIMRTDLLPIAGNTDISIPAR